MRCAQSLGPALAQILEVRLTLFDAVGEFGLQRIAAQLARMGVRGPTAVVIRREVSTRTRQMRQLARVAGVKVGGKPKAKKAKKAVKAVKAKTPAK